MPDPRRYVVIAPVPGGDAFWYVRDSLFPNSDSVVVIDKDMPRAEYFIRYMASWLNRHFTYVPEDVMHTKQR
jgi:hypothetical protein